MNIYIGGDLDGRVIVLDKPCFNAKKVGGVLKSMLTLNEAIIDVKEG